MISLFSQGDFDGFGFFGTQSLGVSFLLFEHGNYDDSYYARDDFEFI